MKYSEKDFNAYSFESFVFSVLRQIAAKSKRELLIKTGYNGKDNHSNNQIQFDAYAPEGFNEINTPVVFEIKYAKDKNGAASSINTFVKRIMGAKLPYDTSLVFITNANVDGAIAQDRLSKSSKYNLIIYDATVISQWIEQYPVDYANASRSLFASSEIQQISGISTSDFEQKTESNIALLRETIRSDDCFSFVLGAGVSVDPGAKSWDSLLSHFEDELEKKGVISNREKLCKKIGGSSIITAQMCKELYKRETDYYWAIHQGLYENAQSINEDYCIYQIAKHVQKCLPKRHFRVLTYNFDEYLEKYLAYLGINYNVLYDDTCTVNENLSIYHVHGFLPQVSAKSHLQPQYTKSIFLTEENYNQLYNHPYSWQIASQLSFFRENTCLFVGCSLSDPNIRRLLELTKKEKRIHFAILTKDKMTNTDIAVASNHFARLGIEVIWVNSYAETTRVLRELL